MKRFVLISLALFLLWGVPATGYSIDIIKLAPGASSIDQRHEYPDTVLRAALDATLDPDGPYTITYAFKKMNRNRALIEIIKGESINVHIAATRNTWEEKAIPIRIPVLKGLLGYRLLFVHKKHLKKFKALKTIEELKSLRAGSGDQWTTTMVLKEAGFTLVGGNDYEGLFKMLNSNRFDYFPRGVNEIFSEFEARKSLLPNIQIEPTKALYFPTPSYFFVSPEYPELADRVQRGMEILVQKGLIDTLFNEFYNGALTKADLNNRIIFQCENPLLSPETPFDRPELWYNP